jgi:beta-galactosidase
MRKLPFFVAMLLVCFAPRLFAVSVKLPPSIPPLMYGSAWYPEQWPEAEWDADLERMQKAGMNMVRIGEFAWSSLEPTEGRYDFDWMERAVAAAARRGMVTILGTPTDTPPAGRRGWQAAPARLAPAFFHR